MLPDARRAAQDTPRCHLCRCSNRTTVRKSQQGSGRRFPGSGGQRGVVGVAVRAAAIERGGIGPAQGSALGQTGHHMLGDFILNGKKNSYMQ